MYIPCIVTDCIQMRKVLPVFRLFQRFGLSCYHRHSLRASVLPAALGLGVGLSCLTAPIQSTASSGTRYLQLRRETHCDPKLSYALVQTDAARYVGHVLELRGTVGGVAEGPGSLSVMLNMDGVDAPTLEVPTSEGGPIRDMTTPRVRVLVRVGQGGSGNVVPLVVLAVANESEVAAQENMIDAQAAYKARKEELKRQEREQWHQQVVRSASRASAVSPSRGGYVRAPQSPVSAPDYGGTLGPRVRDWYPAYFNFILNHNRKLGANMAGQIAFYLLKFSDEHEVDPRLVTAMIIAESDFDPLSTSHSGAMGLGQLMPDEVKGLHLSSGYDIRDNLYGSIANLRSDLNSFASLGGADGTLSIEQIRLAMATYNAGPGAVKKYKGVPPYKETQGYVKRVVRLYRQFCGLPPE